MYAEVAVQTDAPYQQAFSYGVPPGMTVAPGSGVLVPFGRHTLAGVVLEVGAQPAYTGATRYLLAAAGALLTPRQIALAHWISRRYVAPLYPCVALMLPPGFDKRLRVLVSVEERPAPADLAPPAAKMLATISAAGEIDAVALRRHFRGATASLLAGLRERGLVREQLAFAVPPFDSPAIDTRPALAPSLTVAQRRAVRALAAATDAPRAPGERPPVFLLHGVTGSGKTEVYLAALERVVARGGRGIVLVPEIGLTPQMVARFERRFPGGVAVVHSDITGGRRERQWHAIRAGRFPIVVGTRSALFAPQPDLGLLVIDEEHEWTHKQVEPEPRYHARDVAIRLAQLHGASVLLGSATPDVASYARAAAGHYTLLSMPERIDAARTTAERALTFADTRDPRTNARVADVERSVAVGAAPPLPYSPVSDARQPLAAAGRSTPGGAALAERSMIAHSVAGAQPVAATLALTSSVGGPCMRSNELIGAQTHSEVGTAATLRAVPAPAGSGRMVAAVAERPAAQSPAKAVQVDDQPPSQRGGLPSIEIVDLALELREGNRGIFSRALDGALAETLARGEQALLFLNRRGSASFVLCRDCGHVPQCGGCHVPYTVHAPVLEKAARPRFGEPLPPPAEVGERLRCHHCNRQRRLPAVCPGCGGDRLRYFGLGTQRVEAAVRERFPASRVLRWDRDAVRCAADHAAILAKLENGEADVVVGTQMLAKGHDLPKITLVGVVSADIALNLPDFRSGERAYQLLTQVAGRAGRGERPGRVIIQTYTPDHYAIRAAATHDYRAMYEAELRVRREAGYPPFGRLTRLLFSHGNAARAEAEARRLAAELRDLRERQGLPGVEVIGPAPAFHARVRGRTRWQIVLRANDPAELLAGATLRKGWSVDVDPVSLV